MIRFQIYLYKNIKNIKKNKNNLKYKILNNFKIKYH